MAILDPTASDFTFEADMTVINGLAEGLIGFIFRASGVDTDIDYYVFQLWAAGHELKSRRAALL